MPSAAQYYYNGYISNFRITIGTAVYTSAFTPPTTPVSAVSNTQFLISSTNAGIFDQTAKNDITTYGSAAISTTQSKFGGSSMYFNGSSSYMYAAPSQNFYFGTGSFTCEGWVYINAAAQTAGIFQIATSYLPTSTVNTVAVGTTATGFWQIYANGTNTNSTATYNTGQWIHFALVRSGTTTTLYINGTSVITVTGDSTNYTGTYLALGGIYGGNYINAYLDDFRITQYARYTTNFTPPTSAFPNQ